MGEPEPLGEILAQKKFGAPRRKKSVLDLIRANWGFLAGERLAEKTVPTRLTRGTLTIAASGGSWAAEMCLAEKTIMAGIEKLLGPGTVRRIRVRARAAEPPAPQNGPGEKKIPVPDDAYACRVLEGTMRERLETVGDKDVRDALARLLRTSRAGEQSRQREE